MANSISAKYGPATLPAARIEPVLYTGYNDSDKTVATWEDSQNLFRLVRSAFTNRFGLLIFSKRVNAEVELAIAEAVALENQEKPQREADLKKKEAADLEAERQKNQKAFRP
jgi:hypothetical protein